MKYSCITIDDEPLSHTVLKNHLEHVAELEWKAGFYNAPDAEEFLNKETVDLIFLDIHMPEKTGLEFLRGLKVKPVTILTTAYRDYAVEGFELGVIDYLLKPVQFERFEMATKRAIDFLQLAGSDNMIDFAATGGRKKYELLIKTGTTKVLLDYRTITFAQGLKDYTILHTGEKKYVVKGSVKNLEDFLPGDFFIRVHKSFIVARNKIKLLHRNKIEFDQVSIPVGRNYKSGVEEYLQSASSGKTW